MSSQVKLPLNRFEEPGAEAAIDNVGAGAGSADVLI